MSVSRETDLGAELRSALVGLDLDTSRIVPRLEEHWNLVCSWNRRMNLTSIVEPDDVAWLHYRDSLEALAHLPPGDLVDLGTGGGFPGVPLAIAAPSRLVTLVEVKQKKCSFLQTCRARLGLTNVTVHCARIQSEPLFLHAAAITRATFSSEKDLRSCLRWVKPGGVLLAMRAEGEELASGDVVHRYLLRGERRLIARWVRATG